MSNPIIMFDTENLHENATLIADDLIALPASSYASAKSMLSRLVAATRDAATGAAYGVVYEVGSLGHSRDQTLPQFITSDGDGLREALPGCVAGLAVATCARVG